MDVRAGGAKGVDPQKPIADFAISRQRGVNALGNQYPKRTWVKPTRGQLTETEGNHTFRRDHNRHWTVHKFEYYRRTLIEFGDSTMSRSIFSELPIIKTNHSDFAFPIRAVLSIGFSSE
jgi:hypothetical protein